MYRGPGDGAGWAWPLSLYVPDWVPCVEGQGLGGGTGWACPLSLYLTGCPVQGARGWGWLGVSYLLGVAAAGRAEATAGLWPLVTKFV